MAEKERPPNIWAATATGPCCCAEGEPTRRDRKSVTGVSGAHSQSIRNTGRALLEIG